MGRTGTIVVGSGKRVVETALPAMLRCLELEVLGVFSRTPKTIEAAGRSFEVEGLDALTAERLSAARLVYLVVAKHAVPPVLGRLRSLGVSEVDLLIETPVLLFKHLGHLDLCRAFRNAWVSEDCTTLPWLDAIEGARSAHGLGAVRHVHLERSAYAYHGVALAKHLLGARVLRGKRTRWPSGLALRELSLQGGLRATAIEPRDYRAGRWWLACEHGAIADHALSKEELLLEAVLDGGRCVGFRCGDVTTELDDDERALIGEPSGSSGVSAWMDGGKRVGFLRLLRGIAREDGAYPLDEAVDDAVVDYHLDKLGRYLSNPVTHVRAAPGRLLMKALAKVSTEP